MRDSDFSSYHMISTVGFIIIETFLSHELLTKGNDTEEHEGTLCKHLVEICISGSFWFCRQMNMTWLSSTIFPLCLLLDLLHNLALCIDI